MKSKPDVKNLIKDKLASYTDTSKAKRTFISHNNTHEFFSSNHPPDRIN